MSEDNRGMILDEIVRQYTQPLEPVPAGIHRGGTLHETTRALLFDVYGTLFISVAGDIGAAEKQADQNVGRIRNLLERFHVRRDVHTLHSDFFDAIRRQKGRMEAQGVDFPEVVIEDIWKELLKTDEDAFVRQFAMEYELIVNPVYPMPHARELMMICREKKIPMGIISNAQFYTSYLFTALMRDSLGGLGFRDDLLFFSYRYGYCKPSLFLFRKAADSLNRLGITAEKTLYVGNDMLKDIYPAQKMGFQTALFAGDKRSLKLREDDNRCRDLSADIVITDLLQIADYL